MIGASQAGASLALGAVAFGASVVLVDNGEFAGGAPFDRHAALAALNASAMRAWTMSSPNPLGLAQAEPVVDFRAVGRHMAKTSRAAAHNGSPERLAAAGVRVVRAPARFRDPRTLAAGDLDIRARGFVIAVGSIPVRPPVLGLDTVDALSLDDLSRLVRGPGRLLVLGGGPEAIAAAQACRRLGSEVTLVSTSPILQDFDDELVALLLARLQAEGVDLLTGASVTGVERRGKAGVRAHVQHGSRLWSIDPTHIMVAGGEAPDVGGLDLAAAGVAVDEASILADGRLRTSNPRIRVLGVAAGGSSAPPRAAHQVGVILRALLFRASASENVDAVPRQVMTDPEIAEVGLSEIAARTKAGRIRVLRWPYADNLRAQAEGRAVGHIKVIADGRGRILGASILGAGAGEAIGAWSLAVAKGLTLADMAAWSPASPSFGEIGKSVAVPYLAETARRPSTRRLVRFLKLFG
ncbi:MAG: FAD-dependent oxidoreductase [Rhizobiaceae bacterium]